MAIENALEKKPYLSCSFACRYNRIARHRHLRVNWTGMLQLVQLEAEQLAAA